MCEEPPMPYYCCYRLDRKKVKEISFTISAGEPQVLKIPVGGTAEPDNFDFEIVNHGSEPVNTPWLWSDQNIDGFSCSRILEQILPPNISDTERLIRITRFLAGHFLHTTGATDLDQGLEFYNLPGNPVYNYNSLGCCSCGHFTAAAIQLIEAMGWAGAAQAFTWKGHTVCMTRLPLRNSAGEITRLDNRHWYMIDGDGIRGPVYSLQNPGRLADLDELQDNSKNRIIDSCAMPNGILASGLPAHEYAAMVDTLNDNRFYEDQSPFHLRQGHDMRFLLRPAESILRSFRNLGATAFENGRPRQLSSGRPCHMYGSNDGVYPKPQYERPHVFGNGFLIYQPDLNDPKIRQTFQSGSFSWPIQSPYGLVGAKISFETDFDSNWEIVVRCENQEKPMIFSAGQNDGEQIIDLTSAFRERVYFQFHIEIKNPARRVPRSFRITSTFLCNPRGLPFLETGINRLYYRDFSPISASRNLAVRWRWQERQVNVDLEKSEILVLDQNNQWNPRVCVPANRNGSALLLVRLVDTEGKPAEGCKVLLHTSRPEDDEIIPEPSYTRLCSLFDHHPGFDGKSGTLNLNTMSAPVITINNEATIRIPEPNHGLIDRTGREYLGTRLFRVSSAHPGISRLSAILPNGRPLTQTVQINFQRVLKGLV
jgi:hypothetical protein